MHISTRTSTYNTETATTTMNIQPIAAEMLSASVIAVPPLARRSDLTLNREENEKQIRHLEFGGVSTLLYGGNAILHHIAVGEYSEFLQMLMETAAEKTLVIPSVGPSYGVMMEQAKILRQTPFSTAMILPTRDVTTPGGVATAVRHFVEKSNRPAVLYIKHDGFIDVARVKQLMDEGLLSWIKYAIVREDTSSDDYLRELVDSVGAERIVSGIGEQPAITHLRDFGLTSFTSGCVCVAPRLSMEMLQAIQSSDFERAEGIRRVFSPLESLRNAIHPVRVLHTAVSKSGVANMGPITPLLCDVEAEAAAEIEEAATDLLAKNEG